VPERWGCTARGKDSSSCSAAIAAAQSGDAGIDKREVVAGGLRQRGPPAGGRRGGGVALAVGVGHVPVGAGVQAAHGDTKRHRGDRVGKPVLLRQLAGAAAHEVERRRATDPLSRAVGKREHPGLGHDSAHRDERPAAPAAGPGAPAGAPGVPCGSFPLPAAQAARCPPALCPTAITREVSTGSVASRSIPAPTSSNVPGPAAPGECPPVLQVPRGVPARHQVRRQRAPE